MEDTAAQPGNPSESSFTNMSTWTPPTFLLAAIPVHIWLFTRQADSSQPRSLALTIGLAAASTFWLCVVSGVVPEPYLDEFFHIPQAQKYCQGRFQEWDDKITTPPGLYLFSIIVPGVVKTTDAIRDIGCDARNLRAVNTLLLLTLSYLVLLCRQRIEARLHEANWSVRLSVRTSYATHSAINIALFPLLFFFSGLYYTDVISTTVVVAAFLHHLSRIDGQPNSILSDFVTILLGLLSLFMRQTNVFWTVVFMGGLEAVHAVKSLRPQKVDKPPATTLWEQVKFSAWRYSLGDVHDLALNKAWPEDMLFCIISMVIAAICNPLRVARQIWPHITVLAAFTGFVVWNGSVVLGDKSNHVATIHLAQMLYIWPFFAFFSLPLVFPCVLPIIFWFASMVYSTFNRKTVSRPQPPPTDPSSTPSAPKEKGGLDWPKKGRRSNKPPTATYPKMSTALHAVHSLLNSAVVVWPAYILTTGITSAAIVKYNTIIHPFTLADNRHYMFYVFRYTIRRATWIRYFLLLPYTVSRWMVWATLAGCYQRPFTIHDRSRCSGLPDTDPVPNYVNRPIWTPRIGQDWRATAEGQEFFQNLDADMQQHQQTAAAHPSMFSTQPVATSTGLIFLLATTLSLITAPLVEPRYFILPWVMWRLLMPAWLPHSHGELKRGLSRSFLESRLGKLLSPLGDYDVRLVAETLWFLMINLVTGYIFLSWPYVWRDEHGTVLDGGRWQRFMW